MHLTFMSLVFFRRLPWALDYGLSLGCHGIFEREFECIGLHKVLPHSRCLVSSPTAQSLQPELTLVTSTIMHSCNMHRLRLIQIEPWLPEKIHHSLSLSCHSNPKSNQLSRGITKICVHVVCCKGNLSRINLSKTFSFIYGVPSTTADIIEDPHSQVLFIWLSCIQILGKCMGYFLQPPPPQACAQFVDFRWSVAGKQGQHLLCNKTIYWFLEFGASLSSNIVDAKDQWQSSWHFASCDLQNCNKKKDD